MNLWNLYQSSYLWIWSLSWSLVLFLPPSWFCVPGTKCLVKPQKHPCCKAGAATAPGRAGSGTELDSNESVLKLKEHATTQQAPLAAVAEIYEEPASKEKPKEKRAGVKRRHGRLCRNWVFDRSQGLLESLSRNLRIFSLSKSPASDTWIGFGEAKIEDLSLQEQLEAAEKFRVQGKSWMSLTFKKIHRLYGTRGGRRERGWHRYGS